MEGKEYALPLERRDQITVRELLNNERGFFTVTFIRRRDNKLRIMNGRTGVRKYLKGTKGPYDLKKKGLVLVWTREGYRSVPVANVISISLGGMIMNFA